MKKLSSVVCVLALLLCVCLFAGCASAEPAAPVVKSETNCIVINYFRPDGEYGNWDIWLWEAGGAGVAYAFTGETEAGAQLIVPNHGFGSKEMCFLTRKGGDMWLEKDTADDRSFMLDENGNAEIFLVSGDATIYDVAQ